MTSNHILKPKYICTLSYWIKEDDYALCLLKTLFNYLLYLEYNLYTHGNTCIRYKYEKKMGRDIFSNNHKCIKTSITNRISLSIVV